MPTNRKAKTDKPLTEEEKVIIHGSKRKIQTVSIGSIKEYENNPRLNDTSVRKVAESIRKYGFNVPITVDKDGVIATGHTRYKAAKLLGLEEVPVIYLDNLSDAEIKAWRLVDNKAGEQSGWDDEKLGQELDDLFAEGIDLSSFGFKPVDETKDVPNDDDFFPAPPRMPIARRGDVYRLGDHYLMCGDSTSREDMDTLVGETKIDLVVTDPPYNVDYAGKIERHNNINSKQGRKRNAHRVQDTIANDALKGQDFLEWLTVACQNMADHMKAGAVFYIFYSSLNTVFFYKACEAAGLHIKQQLVWVKNHFVLGAQDYQWRQEPILYGWTNGSHYFINDRSQETVVMPDYESKTKEELIEILKDRDRTDNTDVLQEGSVLHADLHPTMKPVKLLSRMIANSSVKGDTVLDPFGGSGSTLIACEDLGRSCYMMEFDPHYCDVIIERWEQKTGGKAERIHRDE